MGKLMGHRRNKLWIVKRNKNRSLSKIWHVYGFDVETTGFNDEFGTELRFYTIAGENGFRLEGFKRSDFWYQINALLDTKSKVAIIPYNLEFDVWHVHHYDKIPLRAQSGCKWVLVKDCYDTNPNHIILKEKRIDKVKKKRYTGRILTFLDLGNYVYPRKMGLANIAEKFLNDVKYEKPNFDGEITQKYKDYCYQDSKICLDVFMKWFKADALNGATIRVSSPSISFAESKKKSGWKPFYRPAHYKNCKVKCDSMNHVIEHEQYSYFGGLNWVNNGITQNDWFDGIKLDVTGMYSYAQKNMKVPIKYKNYIETRALPTVSDDFYYLILAKIYIKLPFIPFREADGSVEYPYREFRRRFFTEDELFGMERLGVIEIVKCYGYHYYDAKIDMFEKFIDDLFAKKTKADHPKHEGKYSGLVAWYKLKLNGCYGKYAERERVTKDLVKEIKRLKDLKKLTKELNEHEEHLLKIYEVSLEEVLFRQEETQYVNGLILRRKFGRVLFDVASEREAQGKCTLISSIITSRARVYLIQLCYIAGFVVFYLDTDSLTVPPELYPLFEEYMGSDLGMLKIEDNGKFQFRGKKDYTVIKSDTIKIKNKGISIKQLIEELKYNLKLEELPANKLLDVWQGGDFTFKHVLKVREAQKLGLEPYIQIDKNKKRLKILDIPLDAFRDIIKPYIIPEVKIRKLIKRSNISVK